MPDIRKILRMVAFYLVVFFVTVLIGFFFYNRGTVSGQRQDTGSTLPVISVLTGGEKLNRLHGYAAPVDGGYFRETLTAVGKSRTINLCLTENEEQVTSASFELFNDQYTKLIESGECTPFEKSNALLQTQIVFRQNLKSNCEYVLCIHLQTEDEKTYYYYTRVRYGSDLKVAEKLKFVMDFNEATFSKDSIPSLNDYLDSDGSDAADYSFVNLKSSAEAVTWGDLSPGRTSEIGIRLLEINTETAAFALSYMIEASAGDINTFYHVNEYYRLRIGDDKIYLLDFERTMTEDLGMTQPVIEDGMIRLGIGDNKDILCRTFGTDTQSHCSFIFGGQLWLCDLTNRIVTDICEIAPEYQVCDAAQETGIKVIKADPETGDLYFILYGYMHSGRYEGREGVLIYHYSHEDVLLEEMMFIPYDKGSAQLAKSVETLSYMNDAGTIYLMLDDVIYKIDPALGYMQPEWTDLDSHRCAVSDEGLLVISEGEAEGAFEYLTMTDLNNQTTQEIRVEGSLIKPLGFAADDLVYGLVDPAIVAEDSEGMLQAPVSSICIVDKNLQMIRKYEKLPLYISRVDIEDGNIHLKLVKAAKNGVYTDYEEAGEDYIARNVSDETETAQLVRSKDAVRGIQNWIDIPGNETYQPISQTARDLDPGYDITKDYHASEAVSQSCYLYTKGRLYDVYPTVQEAISNANEESSGITVAGTVMTSHKQVLWQRAGRAYIWDLGIEGIKKAGSGLSETDVLLDAIAAYEGWEITLPESKDEPLFAAMTDCLPAETINLSGLALTDALHFVYRDRLLAVKCGQDHFCLITAYTQDSITFADPKTGELDVKSFSDAEKMLSDQGNVFYSYIDE